MTGAIASARRDQPEDHPVSDWATGRAGPSAELEAVLVHRSFGTAVVEVHPDGGGFLNQPYIEQVVDRLEEIAAEVAGGHLAIDLSYVTSITAQFLSVVSHFWKRLRRLNGELSLWGVNSQCAELFRFSGLDELIDCYAAPYGIGREYAANNLTDPSSR